MPLDVEIKRDVLFAPEKHVSLWALNPTYTSPRTTDMVMSVTETDGHGLGANRWMEWTTRWRPYRSWDNGATWHSWGNSTRTPLTAQRAMSHVGYEGPWAYWLEPQSGRLIGFHSTPKFPEDFKTSVSRFFWTSSTNGGLDWDSQQRIIHAGDGCDAQRWLPDFDPERHVAGLDQPHAVTLDDGTLVFGFTVKTPRYVTRFFRGRWDKAAQAMVWEAGQGITVPAGVSSTGPCEPDLLPLGGQRLFASMRTQGIPGKVPSTRQCAVSDDGGRTWSKPEPLKYDDGSNVWVPAAVSVFERAPQSGRAFWFANIQPGPVYGQLPRYPLVMAEFDTKRLCIMKDSVTVIQALPPGAPQAGDPKKGELGRRYSNFGHYVDRKTGEFVLLVAEEPRSTWDDLWADTIRLRVKLKGA